MKAALRLPAFDSYEWEDAEVLQLMQTMFTELNLIQQFNIPLSTLREWLYEVYKYYNDVPFHNFRHCFCVAQMVCIIILKLLTFKIFKVTFFILFYFRCSLFHGNVI